AQFYGMTVDGEGRTWTGGCSGPVYRFDPMDETFTAVPGTQACHRGVAADREGHIWVASNGPCGVAEVDADTATLVEFHNLAPCSTPVGVSVDTEGFVWVVDQSQGAWKIDPINPVDKTFLPVSNTHYTYSDMTGGQLRSVLPQ
ncbi:MAG: lyase, partial [Nannocystaceae bacterium]